MLPRIVTQTVFAHRLTLDGITTRTHTHLIPDSNCKLTDLSQLPNNRFGLFPHWQNQCSNGNSGAMRRQTMAPIIGCLCKAYDGLNWYFIHPARWQWCHIRWHTESVLSCRLLQESELIHSLTLWMKILCIHTHHLQIMRPKASHAADSHCRWFILCTRIHNSHELSLWSASGHKSH